MRVSPRTALPDSATQSQTVALSEICGFWPDVATPTSAWTYFCGHGSACAIDIQVTPHIVFCPGPGYTPHTTWYDYGKWPSMGCGSRENCCPRGWRALIKNYDNGASINGQCVPSSDTVPTAGPLSATTETYGTSIHLSVWNAVGAADLPTTATSFSLQVLTTTTGPVGGDPSQTLQALPTVIAAGPAPQDGLSIGAEVGSILGAIFGAIALAVAIYFGRKQYKRLSRPEGGKDASASATV